ncbi:MAG: hemolysin family protein [Tenuifilaceae bacterium]|jgi:CBS domain containing-hemolysin-like protein|nr:hemolysin family protein [Bacteroidales bacterium]MDI9515535.1 hemolysin family protein [Bacteroidota bacterium]NLH55890.1 HlyC/CorC family transporter [Rikenellaceae bacterium]OQC63594.1 MAG: Hemolysin C [Bacteroidetes bacterium ADurb.Bin008]HNV81108.1 hemolysin family protein [Tenuifilaceae bacterium]
MDYNPLVIGLSILFSALFSGMEIAFLSANKLRIELDSKQGTFTSNIIQIFSHNPNQYITTMLIGNSIALVIYGIEMARLLYSLFLRVFDQHILDSNPMLVLVVQTILSTMVILITAEFLPKSIFRVQPNRFLKFFALPILFFYIIFYPISVFSTWLSLGLIRGVLRQKVKTGEEKRIINRVDLDHFVSTMQGADNDDSKMGKEIKIFQNALDFSEIRVRDCMIPRTDIEAIEVNKTIEDLKEIFIKTNYSRLPVYAKNIDNIIGYVNSKDLFKMPQSIKSKLLKIEYVPETMLASKLITLFIKEQKSIAIVVDEFGGTAGLVTIEDVFEEIFGEIDDEHDESEFIEKQLGDNEYLLSGRLEVDHLNEKFNLEIPESDEYDTLAGYVLYHYQSIPKPSEIIDLNNFHIKVAKMDGSRIDLLYLKKHKNKT